VTTSAYQASGSGGRNASPIRSQPERFGADAKQASYQGNRRSRTSNTNAGQNSAARSSQVNEQQFSRDTGFNSKFSSSGNITGQSSSPPTGQPQSSQQSSSPPNPAAPNLANRRGQGWALPSRPQGGTGYLRPITVVCSANDLRIKTATGQERTIDFESGPINAVDLMVEEIWNRIDSWGIAGQGSYWKPQLRIKVQPGGEQRFAMLQQMLHNSGLVIQQESKQ